MLEIFARGLGRHPIDAADAGRNAAALAAPCSGPVS
jgi:hypothetical protein